MSSLFLSQPLPWSSATENFGRAGSDVSRLQLIGGVAVLVALGFQLLSALLTDPADAINLWGPIALAGTCMWAIVFLVDSDPLWMWSPLVTALAAMAIYHGLGPLLHVFGDANAIAYANQFASINADELARTNLLDLWSLACMLAVFSLCFRVRRRDWSRLRRVSKLSGGTAVKVISWSMIVIALPVKYFVVLPYFLRWTDPEFVLPGFVVALGNLSFLCLFLLLYCAWSRSKMFYMPAAVVFAMEIVTGLLCFNKSEIITTFGVAFLGFYFVRPSKRLAAAAITVIAVVYLIITPVVSKGRGYLNTNPASVSDRVEALKLAWRSDSEDASGSRQGWWSRLCYSNAQAYCLREHDAGMPGHTFELILPAIVPRVLWPDKPMMTPGFDFNQLVTGNPHSSSAPGVFAEAYWAGGWPAVFATSAYLGLLFSWFTRIGFRYVAERDVRWLPFGIGGLLTGASLTDWFASTYVGGAVTYAAYFAAIHVLMPAAATTFDSKTRT